MAPGAPALGEVPASPAQAAGRCAPRTLTPGHATLCRRLGLARRRPGLPSSALKSDGLAGLAGRGYLGAARFWKLSLLLSRRRGGTPISVGPLIFAVPRWEEHLGSFHVLRGPGPLPGWLLWVPSSM